MRTITSQPAAPSYWPFSHFVFSGDSCRANGVVRLVSWWCDASVLRSSQTGRPLIGAPEIGAALSGYRADALDCAHGELEHRKLYANGRLTDGAGWDHVSARHLHVKLACTPLSICADSSLIYSLKRLVFCYGSGASCNPCR